jgi:hypothetical protein
MKIALSILLINRAIKYIFEVGGVGLFHDPFRGTNQQNPPARRLAGLG